jgi:hypothetical protein
MCPPGLYAILLAKHVVRHDLGKIRMDRLKPVKQPAIPRKESVS